MFYRLGNNNKNDQGDEVKGLEREGYREDEMGEGEIGEGRCEEIILCLSLT
jgi:hypothetical protein